MRDSAAVVLLLATMACAAQADTPLPNTRASIEAGRVLYLRHCTECHGADGRAPMDVVANATALPGPGLFLKGTGVADVYRTIDEGAAVAEAAWGPQHKSRG